MACLSTGIGMMIFQMYFGMSRCFGMLAAPLSWLANAALLLQFPLGHSLLLSAPGRRLLARLAPRAFSAELSATTYVIVASGQVLVLFSLLDAEWRGLVAGAGRAVVDPHLALCRKLASAWEGHP